MARKQEKAFKKVDKNLSLEIVIWSCGYCYMTVGLASGIAIVLWYDYVAGIWAEILVINDNQTYCSGLHWAFLKVVRNLAEQLANNSSHRIHFRKHLNLSFSCLCLLFLLLTTNWNIFPDGSHSFELSCSIFRTILNNAFNVEDILSIFITGFFPHTLLANQAIRNQSSPSFQPQS